MENHRRYLKPAISSILLTKRHFFCGLQWSNTTFWLDMGLQTWWPNDWTPTHSFSGFPNVSKLIWWIFVATPLTILWTPKKTWGLFDFHFSRGFPVQPLTKSMAAMASPDSHVHLGIKIWASGAREFPINWRFEWENPSVNGGFSYHKISAPRHQSGHL